MYETNEQSIYTATYSHRCRQLLYTWGKGRDKRDQTRLVIGHAWGEEGQEEDEEEEEGDDEEEDEEEEGS